MGNIAPPIAEFQKRSAAGHRVLVITDPYGPGRRYPRMLREDEFTVTTAAHGRDALRALLETPFHLILLGD